MGSVITLGIGRLNIDWAKNDYFINHSKLFLPNDKKSAPYYYVTYDTGEPIVEDKIAFARQLKLVKRRLELLGFTLENAWETYEDGKVQKPDFYENPEIDFDMFIAAMRAVDVDKVEPNKEYTGYKLEEYVAHEILQNSEFNKPETNLYSLTKWDGKFFENLHPYITLRLLAENQSNLEKDVIWRYADVVEGGWVDENELYEGIDREETLSELREFYFTCHSERPEGAKNPPIRYCKATVLGILHSATLRSE
jgi:hypothetical protein